jgi:hypothetical protein
MNSLTYKTDDSFFTVVIPPRCAYGFWTFHQWFQQNSTARFRVIRDSEVEEDRLTLAQIDDIYPGIKTLGVVMNPWARAYYSYKQSILNVESQKIISQRYKGVDFSSFDNYIPSLLNCTTDDTVLHPTTNQLHWVSKDGKLTDYLIRIEHIHKDFKPLQDYFCTDIPLTLPKKPPSYKKFYNETTKEIVATVFKEDIERFNYKF